MDLVEGGAGNLAPVLLGVGGAGDGGAVVGARYWPAGLGNPDPCDLSQQGPHFIYVTRRKTGQLTFAGGDIVHDVADSVDGVPESVGGVFDSGGLEVWVSVGADEVGGLDNSSVGAVHPRGPGVNMSDLLGNTHCAHHTPDVVDLLCKRRGVGVATVQVLAADGNGNHPVRAVCVDGGLEGLLLGIVVGGVLGPDADEELSAGGDGGWDGIGEGVAVRGGVDTDGGEVAGKILEELEGTLPLSLGGQLDTEMVWKREKSTHLGLARSVWVLGRDVETLPVGSGVWESCYESSCDGEELHD